jgi:hypothetical protein
MVGEFGEALTCASTQPIFRFDRVNHGSLFFTRNVTSNGEPVTTPSEEKVGLGRSAHSPAAMPASAARTNSVSNTRWSVPAAPLASCSNS